MTWGTRSSAVKERIESELQIARQIQMGILPKIFPPFPGRPEIDIHASVEPAREVNAALYPDNPRCMFVTLQCAVLDVRTGELTLANAGHNPPLTAGGEPDGYLDVGSGTVIGALPEVRIDAAQRTMAPGATLLMYTDGVTECMNPDRELYSEETLEAFFCAAPKDDMRELTEALQGELRAFAAGAPQSDDTTILCLKYRGPAT